MGRNGVVQPFLYFNQWRKKCRSNKILDVSDITLVLDAINRGENQASERLLPLVYNELRNLATARMIQESAGHTLQPTALVHEAWLRLVGDANQNWKSRAYFFAAAAEAMRRILVEHAKSLVFQNWLLMPVDQGNEQE